MITHVLCCSTHVLQLEIPTAKEIPWLCKKLKIPRVLERGQALRHSWLVAYLLKQSGNNTDNTSSANWFARIAQFEDWFFFMMYLRRQKRVPPINWGVRPSTITVLGLTPDDTAKLKKKVISDLITSQKTCSQLLGECWPFFFSSYIIFRYVESFFSHSDLLILSFKLLYRKGVYLQLADTSFDSLLIALREYTTRRFS